MGEVRAVYILSDSIKEWLSEDLSVSKEWVAILSTLILFVGILIISFLVWRLGLRILNSVIPKMTKKTKTLWDDIIFNKKVVRAIAHLLPTLIINYYSPLVFRDYPVAVPVVKVITDLLILLIIAEILLSFFNSMRDILLSDEKYRDKPIGSYTQLGKIIVYVFVIILAISLIFDKSPLYLLSGVGAVAAVLLLVFKDTILGLVASVQLSANDMLRIGDWVTMEKYGADGDVIEINLATVKVQNFDKTITTIPTYAFISDSFRNWRGMMKSEGRRIKRSFNIKIDSIKYCDPSLLNKFKKYQLISDFIETKEKEIEKYNEEHKIDKSQLINGRHLTNIGVFRRYIESYLVNNPNLNTKMTYMVRQLSPSEKGLPLEIYTFSGNKDWVDYEAIQADLFDHIFAAAPNFELEVFESPSGTDFRNLGSN